jgi:hypothetical protein
VKRGQISSIDVLVGIILFIFVLVTLRGVWLSNLESGYSQIHSVETQLLATQAIDVLLKTPGYPIDWSSSNVEVLGLADKPLVLNEAKVSEFISMSYEDSKSLLGLGSYEYRIDFNNNGTIFSKGPVIDSIGRIVSMKRVVWYNGGRTDVTFTVFD